MRNLLRSPAFRRGFVDGLTAPYRFMFARMPLYTRSRGDLLARSWLTVGYTIKDAMRAQDELHGETAGAKGERAYN